MNLFSGSVLLWIFAVATEAILAMYEFRFIKSTLSMFKFLLRRSTTCLRDIDNDPCSFICTSGLAIDISDNLQSNPEVVEFVYCI